MCVHRRRSDRPSAWARGFERVRVLGARFVRWQTPFSFVSSMISLLLALVFAVDLVVGHPEIQRDIVTWWLVLYTLGAVVPLALGRLYSRQLGLILAVGIEAWSTYFLVFSHHTHAEINALLALPLSALYIGWFFPARIAVPFMALSALRVCVTLVWNPSLGAGVGSPLTLVSYAVLIALFTFAGARLVRRQVRTQAATDPLTGVLNRRGLRGSAQRLRQRAARRGLPVTLVIIDFDDFRLVNEEGGHSSGDLALRESAHAWRELVGMRGAWDHSNGIVARIGGDEFVLLLPLGLDAAESLLRHAQQTARHSWTWGAVLIEPDEALESATDRADSALYRSKQRR